jgi:argininosuccinate lyase
MNLWKSRFTGRLHPEALAFSSSLSVDGQLYREDIDGSLAHAAMLARQKIIPARDAKRITGALKQIRREIEGGSFDPGAVAGGRFTAEDIHMAIEARLIEKVGKVGGKLHTARSRNDQIALDIRLYLRTSIRTMLLLIPQLQKTLVKKARQYEDVLMPGYTHLQRAQPVLLAHHLLAYVEMLHRDHGRFEDAWRRADKSPLGAGALAGTPFPIDRNNVATSLGFSGVVDNSIDAVSDRDSVIEFVAASAITMMHLSRLAEELILWSSQEWSFLELDDAFTTGSSMMPQKKNPDMAELVRGKTGRVYGDLVALLTLMKGLPLAYNRDMQEDKGPLFDSVRTTAESLRIMTLMLRSASFKRNRFEEEMGSDFLLATDLADYLVGKGMPFRKAHAVVGGIVNYCVKKHLSFNELPFKDYRRFAPQFDRDIFALLNPKMSVRAKRSMGSTSPRQVQRALARWEKRLSRRG